MCGIAGIYAPGRLVNPAAVQAMTDSIALRGPDDQGQQSLDAGQLVLGHRRLAILDLSASGHQPMSSADRRATIVFNGEIYNFRELRDELSAGGLRFRSESDTEVILEAYCRWGLDAVERFRGMFAFALWDDRSKTLHLCRDRFGVKPLYYSYRHGVLAFASELKALIASGNTDRKVCPVALAEYLRYGYVSAPRSIFEDVRVVPPGSIVSIDAKGCGQARRYWSVAALYSAEECKQARRELERADDEAVLDKVEDALITAFRYRMVSDVPVGLFLSGGIDSSLVAAILARRCGYSLRTFTIGYGNSSFDETPYARAVADHLGAKHTEHIVSGETAVETARQLVSIFDEPLGDSSSVPTLLVSRVARQQVTVALSADGADELFGGYARYSVCGRFVEAHALKRAAYALSAGMLARTPAGLIESMYRATRMGGAKFAAINDKVRKFVRMARAQSTFEAYDSAVTEWSPQMQAELMGLQKPTPGDAEAAFNAVTAADCREAFMHFDASRYLLGDLLTKVDRASMAVSLEAREPFLDHELARLAIALPMKWKIRDGKGKYILRRLLDRHFPAGWFDRPKQGFSSPVDAWMRGPLREMVAEYLSPERVRRAGLLDAAAVDRAWRRFQSGHREVSAAGIWHLFQLQQWAEHWTRVPARVETSVSASHERIAVAASVDS